MPSHHRSSFDPDRVARFEAAGWRAYYDRRWLRLFWLMAQLCREQFRIPFPRSVLAAYWVARGAAAWVPVNHDEAVARRYYDRFYRLARRCSGLDFDPEQVAALEMRYWDDHRRLVGQADKAPLFETLTALHVATFGIGPEPARESAQWRLLAANAVDGITGGTSADVEGDWAAIEDYLRRCYRSIQRALEDPREAAGDA